jgi:hypothetical protein
MASTRKNGAIPAGDKSALRQHGQSEWHPGGCECRKCRRMRAAVARREKPRYGQDTLPADLIREDEED